MEIFKCKDKLYQAVKSGPWFGKLPIKVHEIAAACQRWDGGKIPLEIMRQTYAFFEWGYQETKSETIVHLLYHKEKMIWKATVLPQKGHTGMSVEILPEHPGRAEALVGCKIIEMPNGLRIPEDPDCGGYTIMGTIHHHCTGSAFASSTDTNDEKTKEGLHITIGDLTKPKYTIDLRASWSGELTPVVLSDWFDIPESIKALPADAALPKEMYEQYLRNILTTPPTDMSFPEWWKENVIKVVYAPPSVTHGYFGHVSHSSHSSGPDYRRHGSSSYFVDKLKDELKKISVDYQFSLADILGFLHEIHVEPYNDMIESMVWCEHNLEETIKVVNDMIDNQRADLVGSDKPITQEDLESYGWN